MNFVGLVRSHITVLTVFAPVPTIPFSLAFFLFCYGPVVVVRIPKVRGDVNITDFVWTGVAIASHAQLIRAPPAHVEVRFPYRPPFIKRHLETNISLL
jgi:hypothetical protein